MSTEIRVPALGESVTEATIARWLKQQGDSVSADEPLVELETDKVSLEVPAPAAGVLSEIAAQEGDTVGVDALLGMISASAGASKSRETVRTKNEMPPAAPASTPSDEGAGAKAANGKDRSRIEVRAPEGGESVTEADVGEWMKKEGDRVAADEPLVTLETDKAAMDVAAPAAGVLERIAAKTGETIAVGALLAVIATDGAAARAPEKTEKTGKSEEKPKAAPASTAAERRASAPLSPAPRRVIGEYGLDPAAIKGSGKDGRITKGDALASREAAPKGPAPAARAREPRETGPREERVKMTRLRQTIARRLKEAQETAAMLTTFNDVDMTAVMALRSQYKDVFEKKHGIKLGFMSFFVKACVQALREIPEVNAEIDGTDIIYKNHYDIGVAVGTDRGLVVPVLRDADALSLAEIEAGIADLGKKARDGALSLEDMQGGTFTISNGGVYGSLLSTPILNPPQSGVLGMHRIEERPVAHKGQVVVRPMMYLALSYDHRIVDGKGAVTFLVRVKENLEDPQRLLLDL